MHYNFTDDKILSGNQKFNTGNPDCSLLSNKSYLLFWMQEELVVLELLFLPQLKIKKPVSVRY